MGCNNNSITAGCNIHDHNDPAYMGEKQGSCKKCEQTLNEKLLNEYNGNYFCDKCYNDIKENTENCDGYNNSNCCDYTINEFGICLKCGEHAETACYDCEYRYYCMDAETIEGNLS